MTPNSASSPAPRRRTSLRSLKSGGEEEENGTVPPSRIPVKSPARSASASKIIGGLTVAYSPLKVSSMTSPETPTPSQEYTKKLADLKNAMNLLKTPPPPQQNQPNQPNLSNPVHPVSYTPLRSSTLAHTSPAAANDSSMEMATDSATDTLELTSIDTSLLDAYHDDDSFCRPASGMLLRNVYSSPANNYSMTTTSSPCLSSDDLKRRLEATKDAFQRSLEAQKRRLRTSFEEIEIDSSLSTCCNDNDSDLSLASLKSTKDQLERIRRDVSELIESDLEDVETIRKRKNIIQNTHNNNNNNKNNNNNNLITPINESFTLTLVKYSFVFAITSIVFTYLFICYAPSVFILLESLERVNFLEGFEETLNFILQDN